MLAGLWLVAWCELQYDFATHQGLHQNKNTWAANSQLALLEFTHLVWGEHNNEIHGEGNTKNTTKRKE